MKGIQLSRGWAVARTAADVWTIAYYGEPMTTCRNRAEALETARELIRQEGEDEAAWMDENERNHEQWLHSQAYGGA